MAIIIIKTDSEEEIGQIDTANYPHLRTNDSRGDWDRFEFQSALYRALDLAGMLEAQTLETERG